MPEERTLVGWLYGWKEIADYIGCHIRTAKMYHYELSMPVYRKIGKPKALTYELDLWLKKIDEKTTNIPRSTHFKTTNRPL